MSDRSDQLREQLVGFFFEESTENLELMEAGLVDIDPRAPDPEQINAIFRAIHSVKGASGSFGFGHISDFAHLAETVLDQVRSGSRPLTQEIVDALLQTTDCLGILIQEAQDDSGQLDEERIRAVEATLRAISNDGTAPGPDGTRDPGREAAPPRADAAMSEATELETWFIAFAPDRTLLRTGNDPVRLLRAVGELGTLEVSADLSALPDFDRLDPEDCYLRWNLRLASSCDEASIRDEFSWVEEDCELSIARWCERADETGGSATPATRGREAAELECGDGVLADGVEGPDRAGDGAETPASARRPASTPADPAGQAAAASSIRVGADKVDNLIDMVAELVITQSMLGEIGERFAMEDLDRLKAGLSQLQRNTRELQDAVMKVRMLPMSVAFARFPRLVRDVGRALGKQVELRVKGEQTELDKTVLEQIGDPLVHLVRNSLDHGLETSEERVAAGKPPMGVITLDAFHQGGNIVVEVKDDGRGLDRERIRRKALERGLIGADEALDDARCSDLIFGAGFSTAAELSDVSGRGVGMDVVEQKIHSLGGTIALSSVPGQGVTTTIRLPLTLAILDGQLVRVGQEVYCIPLVSIVESLQVRMGNVNCIAGRVQVVRLRGEHIPIIRLYQLFDSEPDRRELEKALLVVVETGDGRKAGLLVDELQAQQQVVIKSLEANYARVRCLSGATILGNGTVALILDVAGVIDAATDRGAFMDPRSMDPGSMDPSPPRGAAAPAAGALSESAGILPSAGLHEPAGAEPGDHP